MVLCYRNSSKQGVCHVLYVFINNVLDELMASFRAFNRSRQGRL